MEVVVDHDYKTNHTTTSSNNNKEYRAYWIGGLSGLVIIYLGKCHIQH